jgi:CRP/FNR family transcriptional regulator, nitrogen oxide reductase regulator
MAPVDRSTISGFDLFSGFAPEQLDDILRDARSVRFPKNTNVFEQDGEAHSFFVLLHGHLRVVKLTPDGHQIVVRFIAPGELFGGAAAIGRATYPAPAVAVVDSIALVWPSTAWPQLVGRHPTLAAHALHMVGSRLQDAHTRVLEMSTEQVKRRVAHALLRLAKQAGRKGPSGIEIDFPIISAWEEKGWVEGGRQRIVLREPHKLFQLAENVG